MNGRRVRPIVAIAATMALVALALPVANAAASNPRPATASAKKVKKLSQQVRALQSELGQPRPPTGGASGDLTGSFPNPAIAPNAVTSPKIADNAVDGSDIRDSAVGSSEIFDGSINQADLGTGSVGPAQLGGSTAVSGSGVTISAANGPGTATVTCPNGGRVIGGGWAWQDAEPSTILASAPTIGDPDHTWSVRAMVNAGDNKLFAWANCMLP